MTYHKFQATQLFTGSEMLGADAVLVTDEAGRVIEILKESEAGPDIRRFNGLISPGFINCHCHLELSHMRGLIPEKTGLVDFIYTVVTQRNFPEAEMLAAIAGAEDEMLANGIVAVGDICNNASTIPQKTANRLAYYNFVEVSGWIPAVAQIRLEQSIGILKKFGEMGFAEQKTTLVPHAPYSVSNPLWEGLMPFFTNHTVTIHNQETGFEDSLFETGEGDFNRMYALLNMDTSFYQPVGKSSLQTVFPKLQTAGRQLLVHNTFTREEDIQMVNGGSANASWCICINANQYIEQAVPPIDLLRKNHCRIVTGTDSLASNHSLSIMDELKTIRKYYPGIPLAELLGWATLNGAEALQMQDALGSFEKGKKPGILLLSNLSNENIAPETKVQRLL